MNFSILIVIIVLSIILAVIIYQITEKYKGLTVLTEIIIIIISILASWLKSDDYGKNEEQDITITTINEDSKQIEEQETSRETTTTIDTTNTTTAGTTTTTDTLLLNSITTTYLNETETEKTTPKKTSVPPINNSITLSSKETTKNIITSETTTTLNMEWNEIEIKETLYIKESCYSRTKAVVGSDSVRKYSAGTRINVIAATDTGYYKLTDGNYIHSDYVTDKALTKETTNIDESDIFIYSNIHNVTLNVGESKYITITSTIHDGLAVGTTNKSVSTVTWVKPIVWDGDNIQICITAKGCGTARIKVYQKWKPKTYYDYIEVEVIEN